MTRVIGRQLELRPQACGLKAKTDLRETRWCRCPSPGPIQAVQRASELPPVRRPRPHCHGTPATEGLRLQCSLWANLAVPVASAPPVT
jgi:hypothetical protein